MHTNTSIKYVKQSKKWERKIEGKNRKKKKKEKKQIEQNTIQSSKTCRFTYKIEC